MRNTGTVTLFLWQRDIRTHLFVWLFVGIFKSEFTHIQNLEYCWKCFHLYLSDSAANGFACTLFAVLMSNMTMRWDIPTPFKPYAYVNLTCVSINSRPPATLRWYRGVHEVTRSSINNERVTRQNGNLLLAFKLLSTLTL